ncbi:hypothetical protein M0802_000100 [Mischocyttarus mexicanus]|nr:hypothetical protein M0802_000100 [Mischocyttarus mexicanus]
MKESAKRCGGGLRRIHFNHLHIPFVRRDSPSGHGRQNEEQEQGTPDRGQKEHHVDKETRKDKDEEKDEEEEEEEKRLRMRIKRVGEAKGAFEKGDRSTFDNVTKTTSKCTAPAHLFSKSHRMRRRFLPAERKDENRALRRTSLRLEKISFSYVNENENDASIAVLPVSWPAVDVLR